MMGDDQQPERAQRADSYLVEEHNLGGQLEWYDERASKNKAWHTQLGFLIIAAGAFTTILQLWVPWEEDKSVHWTSVATAVLGAVVVLGKGAERIWNFDESWRGYRLAAERLKSERRLYVNEAGAYRGLSEEDGYLTFVERAEHVIAEEQARFWQEPGALEGKAADGGRGDA